MDNWKPIHTAPKDGTEILVIRKEWWTPVNGKNRWIYSKIKQASWNGARFNVEGLDPSHWMPMPEMPRS